MYLPFFKIYVQKLKTLIRKTWPVFRYHEPYANYTRVLNLQQITLPAAMLGSPNHRAAFLKLPFQSFIQFTDSGPCVTLLLLPFILNFMQI